MAQIMIPVAPGELVDKITILQIKNERIDDEDKLKNIRTELSLLTETASKNGVDLSHQFVLELKKINEKLWEIEDDIRDKEREKKFDEEFIQLARAVYFTNDERCRVKNKISKMIGSEFIEEKSYSEY